MRSRPPPGPRRPAIEVTATHPAHRGHARWIAARLTGAADWLPPGGRRLETVSVALVGDARMAALHQSFMGLPGPTDVLTFSLETDPGGLVTDGEIVICVSEARRRARDATMAVRRELLLYAVHGMLHLCGFDDRTPRDFAAMHRAEDRILTRIGVGPVFRGLSS